MRIKEYRENPEAIFEKIVFPAWIKPVHLGSSIGVGRVNEMSEVKQKLEEAFHYDDTILIEKHIEGRQIEFGVLGNEFIRVGPPCEILSHGEFVSYAGKYGSSAMPYRIPAQLSTTEAALGTELAKRIYESMSCKGLARVDFFIDDKGHFWFNEINPFPGCTDTSAFPKLWAAGGVDMTEIADELVALALHRTRRLEEVRGK